MHALRSARADIVAGSIVLVLGCLVLLQALQYPVGSPTHMGPGFFPLGLGIILAVLGLVVIFEGRRGETIDAVLEHTPLSLRAVLAVLASLIAFAEILPRFGLVPATFALVLIMALGDPVLRPAKTILTAVGLSIVAVLIFIVLFDMTMIPFRWG